MRHAPRTSWRSPPRLRATRYFGSCHSRKETAEGTVANQGDPGEPQPPSSVSSALLPGLRHESRELWSHVRPLARGARGLCLCTLRDRHDELEGLLALVAEELVAGHVESFLFTRLGRAV